MTDYATLIELDAYRPGWRVELLRCTACGRRWVAVLHPQAPKLRCECPGCGLMTSEPDPE